MDTVIEIGAKAPEFKLPDLRGNKIALEELQGQIVVINFWSAECTWCERVDHELLPLLLAWKDYARVVWIASNDNETRELIEKVAMDRNLLLVLLDANHQVADMYGAQTTPHFFVVDRKGFLAYQGAWDDITFRHRVATQVYVPHAVDALKDNLTPPLAQTPPYGCVLVRFAEKSS